MTEVRARPCSACPYRRDVPSGVWAPEEYDKLRDYDAPTMNQPFAGFSCHATPEFYCHGWARVHSSRGHAFELLALRLDPPQAWPPDSGVPMFDSAQEAADWGQRDAADPGAAALAAMDKLTRQHERLRRNE